MIEKKIYFFDRVNGFESFSIIKQTGRIVGRGKLIRKNHRETKFIFSTELMGGMVFCNETDREDSRKNSFD